MRVVAGGWWLVASYGLNGRMTDTKSFYAFKHLLGSISAVKHHGVRSVSRELDSLTHVMFHTINHDDDDTVDTCHGRVTTYIIL